MPDDNTFLFLGANTRWVYALARALSRTGAVHAVRFNDWRTYLKNRPSWPDDEPPGSLERTHRVLPTGFAGRLEWMARPFMQRMINDWRSELRKKGGKDPVVVAPYPYLAPWVRQVPEDRLVYYNLDAYTLYRPERSGWIRRREAELVQRAGRTICLSKNQVKALRDRYSTRAERVAHFPLGVLEDFLNPAPDNKVDRGTVGYVGNLTDRVDWLFVRRVAERCSELQFLFAGELEQLETGGRTSGWEEHRAAAFRLPNVEHLGRIPQDDVTELYWKCAVNWIPYDPDHPFNRASCPTKIMDAIASGRPVVSTPVPECTLYPEWIEIVESSSEAVGVLRTRANEQNDHDARAQVAFARQHTWAQRAESFLALVADVSS